MSHLYLVAARVSNNWTNLGVKLPKGLSSAIDVFEAVRYVETGHEPVFDIDSLTTANAEAKIRELALEVAVKNSLQRAKDVAKDAAEFALVNAAGAAVPEIIEQVTPVFDRHAEAYVTAVSKLPNELTADTLISAGPEAVQAYQDAKIEAGYLEGVSTWLATLHELPAYASAADPCLRILRPTSIIELSKIEGARHSANQAVTAISPHLLKAAQLGVEFGINTPREAAMIRQRIETGLAQQVKFK